MEKPKKLEYVSFNSRDCEVIYSCPYCKMLISSWCLPSDYAVENGEKTFCPNCKKEVAE
jgi:hypothetical protein